MGATGAGKSYFAELLAQHLSAKLINADAFQVYRGLDIGTNKPDVQTRQKYELIDIIDPIDDFGVGDWIKRVHPILKTSFETQENVVIVGGTGFYMRALLEQFTELSPPPDPILRKELEIQESSQGLEFLVKKLQNLNPEVAQKIDLKNPVRVRRALEIQLSPKTQIKNSLPPFKTLKLGLLPADDELKNNIQNRTVKLLSSGWIEEVQDLLASGVPNTAPGFRAIGYHNVIEYCAGTVNLDEITELIVNQTWQYARRQKTWLRSEPKLTPILCDSFTEKNLTNAALAVFNDLK